jgi:hypothetical protein
VGDRLTLRRSSVWPMVGLIVGSVVIFLVAFVALHSVIRSYVEPSKAPAPRRLELALVGSTAGLASSAAVVPAAKAAGAPPVPAARPDSLKGGVWAMATLPTWLATVDPAAGLGVPASVDAKAPIADSVARPTVVGLAAVSALAIAPMALATPEHAVPLPRPRPPESKRRR